MADVAHSVPASVSYLDGSQFGFARPGLQVTPFISGRYLTRDWHGFNIREYDLNPTIFQSTADTLEEWKVFWHQIKGGAGAGYVVEPVSETHRDLICGGLADGSLTTFPIPAFNPSSVTAFVDTAPTSTYTLHTAANILTDAEAACSDKTVYADTSTTSADETGTSYDALSCVKTTPAGGANPIITTSAFTSGLSAAAEYTVVAAILATKTSDQNFRVNGIWFESDETPISTSNGANNAIQASDGWTVISATFTTPALTAKAKVSIERNDSSGTDVFYVDCVALAPGDYTRWHLPSQAVGLIECDSAPTSGARVFATATGKRLTRCRFNPGTRWSLSAQGHAAVRSIRAVEWVEF